MTVDVHPCRSCGRPTVRMGAVCRRCADEFRNPKISASALVGIMRAVEALLANHPPMGEPGLGAWVIQERLKPQFGELPLGLVRSVMRQVRK